MEKSEILPPDELDIETEIENIIENGDRKPIARWSKIKYGRLCAMIRPDDPTTNTISETAMFLYGIRMTDCLKARKIFDILYRLAFQWGLVEEAPADILRLATERLRSIKREDIAGMSLDEINSLVASTVELIKEAGNIQADAIAERGIREGRRRATELDGRGSGETLSTRAR